MIAAEVVVVSLAIMLGLGACTSPATEVKSPPETIEAPTPVVTVQQPAPTSEMTVPSSQTPEVTVGQTQQMGCACQDGTLVCQDGTQVPGSPDCLSQRPPAPLVAYVDGPMGGVRNVIVTQADGSDPLQVTHFTTTDEVAFNPRWSPDGSQIAFHDWNDLMDYVGIVNADGSGYHLLLDPSMVVIGPAWSPDGTRLMVGVKGNGIEGKDASSPIYTVKPDGSDLVSTGGYSWGGGDTASWSPDGTKIAYWDAPSTAIYMGATYQVSVVNLDGSEQRKIFEAKLPMGTTGPPPRWSPDQQKIAWTVGLRNGGSTLYLINADGSSAVTLYETGAEAGIYYSDVCWLPDSRRLLTGDVKGILMLDIDGGAPVRLIEDPEAILDRGCLSPDGTQFRYRSHISWGLVTGQFAAAGPLPAPIYLYTAALDGSGQKLIASAPENMIDWDAQGWPKP